MDRMWYMKLVCKITSNVLNYIAFNALQLTTLHLHQTVGPISRHYLRLIFKNLVKLTNLRIECKGTIDEDPDYLPDEGLYTLCHLTHIYFSGLNKCEEVSLSDLFCLNYVEYAMYKDTEQVKCLFKIIFYTIYRILFCRILLPDKKFIKILNTCGH